MALVNEHFLKLPGNYLFADIAKRVNAFKVSHPKVKVISLGIGDVTRPLAPVVIEAIGHFPWLWTRERLRLPARSYSEKRFPAKRYPH